MSKSATGMRKSKAKSKDHKAKSNETEETEDKQDSKVKNQGGKGCDKAVEHVIDEVDEDSDENPYIQEENNTVEDSDQDPEEDPDGKVEMDKGACEDVDPVQAKPEDGPIPLEGQAKFCQERASQIEKSYGQICQSFGSITRKIARLRDKGDLLSKQVMDFADKEKVSVSTSKNLKEFSHNLAAVQDYRDAEIHRLETKVVKPLSTYGPKCKKIKQIIKTEQGAINKEIKQRKNLDKVREKKPGDAHSISAAETELKKAAADASIGSSALNGQMTTFEKEKLTDLKQVLTDFVSIELVFHAKALEYYSKCFENLAMVDEEMDLEEFARKLSASQGSTLKLAPRQEAPMATMSTLGSTGMSSMLGSSSEYTSTGASYTYTYGESTGSSQEKRVRIQGTQPTMYGDEDDDDDDDDYEDDDDDDEDYDPQYAKPQRR